MWKKLFLGLLIVTNSLFGGEKKELFMAVEDYKPYEYKELSGEFTGLNVYLAKIILKRMGYTLAIKEIPWARTMTLIDSGELAMSGSAIKTIEREKYAYFSMPYYQTYKILYIRKGEKDRYNSTNLSDIGKSKMIIGVIRGFNYGEEYSQLTKIKEFKSHIEEVTRDEQNFEKLLAHRIDGLIIDPAIVQNNPIAAKVEPLFIVDTNKACFMFSKKLVSIDFINQFDNELKNIKRDGTYDNLFKKFGVPAINKVK